MITLLLYFIYWVAVSFITAMLLHTRSKSFGEHLLDGVVMAVVFTLLFHWKKVKLVFGRRNLRP